MQLLSDGTTFLLANRLEALRELTNSPVRFAQIGHVGGERVEPGRLAVQPLGDKFDVAVAQGTVGLRVDLFVRLLRAGESGIDERSRSGVALRPEDLAHVFADRLEGGYAIPLRGHPV